MELDAAVLGPLLDACGEELVHKLFRTFLEHAPERVARLEEAAREGDLEAFGMAAHSLRSASATVGASELSELAGELEERAEAGDAARVGADLPRLLRMVEETTELLSSRLDDASPAE